MTPDYKPGECECSRSHALRGNGLPRRFASQIKTQSVHEVRSDAKRRNEKEPGECESEIDNCKLQIVTRERVA